MGPPVDGPEVPRSLTPRLGRESTLTGGRRASAAPGYSRRLQFSGVRIMRTGCLSRASAGAAASLVAGIALGWSSWAVADQPRIVAYVRDGAVMNSIRPEKLTHINFAFAKIDAAG